MKIIAGFVIKEPNKPMLVCFAFFSLDSSFHLFQHNTSPHSPSNHIPPRHQPFPPWTLPKLSNTQLSYYWVPGLTPLVGSNASPPVKKTGHVIVFHWVLTGNSKTADLNPRPTPPPAGYVTKRHVSENESDEAFHVAFD